MANKRIIWCGIALSILFWILESALHAFVFDHGSFAGQLLSPEQHELRM